MKFLDIFEDKHPDEHIKSLEDFSFKKSILQYYANLKNEIYNKREIILFISIIFAITGVFLTISSNDQNLRNIQVLLLIISIFLLLSFSLYLIWKLIKKTKTNFARTIDIFIISIVWCFIYNCYNFIKNNYFENVNLIYNFFLTIPFSLLCSNLILIIFYKLVRKKFEFKTNVILNTWGIFNFILFQKSLSGTYNFPNLFLSFFKINLINLLILFFFVEALICEFIWARKFQNWKKIHKTILLVGSLVLILSSIIPLIFKEFFPIQFEEYFKKIFY